MPTLLEMVADIVAAHAAKSPMTSEGIVEDLKKVHAALHALTSADKIKPALTVKQAFKKDEVICMVCGKGGMKMLARHLRDSHGLKPSAYRKQFGIPSSQSLSAMTLTESRRAMALEKGLADNLAKAREVRAANIQAKVAAAT